MSQEFGVLPALMSILIPQQCIKVEELGRLIVKPSVQSTSFSYQHIQFQSVNLVQLAGDECVDLTAFFVNTRNVDRH